MNGAGSPRAEAPDPARGLPRSEDAGPGLLAVAGSPRRVSRGRRAAYLGGSLAVVVLAVAVVLLAFGDPILNVYGRSRLEGAFAQAHPGWTLRLGELSYATRANRVVAQSIALTATGVKFETGRVSLTGARWVRWLRGAASLAQALEHARLDATKLDLEFPQARYGVRCGRLRASVPGTELLAEDTELRTLVGDEAFFAAQEFRTTRFHLVVPECRVLGVAYADLFEGRSYRADSIRVSRPSFDALVNQDKPVRPFVQSPLMVHETLGTIRLPLRVDRLRITNGRLTYREQLVVGAQSAVLTFGAVKCSVEGIANRGGADAAIELAAQGDLMDAGTLKVRMTIPLLPTELSVHYAGSLAAMDLTRLNAFIGIAERTRVKSGTAREVAFDIQVVAGQARGRVRALYEDLQIAVLDKHTGTERGLDDRITSFVANVLKVRTSNTAAGSGSTKEGVVNYARRPEDEFPEFLWSALWTGVRDAITH